MSAPCDPGRTIWLGVVAEVSTMPDAIKGLAEQHVDDGHGRCTVCTLPGDSRSPARFPCRLASLAMSAAQMRKRRMQR